MLEIEMSADIQDIEPKIIGPLTFRQIVCIVISISYGVPVFLKLPGEITARIIITLLLIMPPLLCGWIKVYDEPLERFVFKMILNTIIKPTKRKYKIENDFENYTEKEKVIKKVKRTKQNKGLR